MADLFSDEWMKAFMTAWNEEPGLVNSLEEIGFSSKIAYGFDDSGEPVGVLVVENGKAIDAKAFSGEEVNWDLRATEKNWQKWFDKGIGMTGLGMAYVSRKLQFRIGDYSAMIKDPRMAGPFIKSFAVMGKV